jgi:hypothetical protein
MRARSFLLALGPAALALAALVPAAASPQDPNNPYFRRPAPAPAPAPAAAPAATPPKTSGTTAPAPGRAGWQRLLPNPPPGNSPPARPREVVEIWVYDDFYAPQMVMVKPGTQMRWVNKGLHHHTVTAPMKEWDSGPINHDGEFRRTFTKPGTYTYFCQFHPNDMEGTIIVGE